jgi:hypothetical protein
MQSDEQHSCVIRILAMQLHHSCFCTSITKISLW